MARPDCDAAPDKVDVFKRGCRSQADLAIVVYSLNENGTLNKLFKDRIVWTCRHHAKLVYAGVLGVALEFKRNGENVKVTAVSIDAGPVPWAGDTELFATAIEQEMRRRLSGL